MGACIQDFAQPLESKALIEAKVVWLQSSWLIDIQEQLPVLIQFCATRRGDVALCLSSVMMQGDMEM